MQFLTFLDENVYGCGFRVRCAASVVSGVRVVGITNGEPALRLCPGKCLHADAIPGRVVVDHAVVVVPEHVLWRRGTLQCKGKEITYSDPPKRAFYVRIQNTDQWADQGIVRSMNREENCIQKLSDRRPACDRESFYAWNLYCVVDSVCCAYFLVYGMEASFYVIK